MVRKTNYRKRFAFTMIELIFAIVIIAISVLSLPMMTQVTQRGIESNILQEAIFAASAELMGASAGYWDERSIEDANKSNMSRVIDIHTGTEPACDTDRLRPGHIAQPLHRRCLDSTTSTNLDSTTDANIFSLDDAADGTTNDIFIADAAAGTADETGYKEIYKSTLTIVPNGNIKTITSTITDKDDIDTITVLRMQSANIGEIDYYKREMP